MERQKRVILIGRTSAGKTTLSQRLGRQALQDRKTQAVVIVSRSVIDTPGEYLERRSGRGALMVTAADADLIVLVQDATEGGTMFPPAYGSQFAKEAVGVVTKIDRADPGQVGRAREYLKMAGAGRIFALSSVTGEGMEPLRRYLEARTEGAASGEG